MSNWVVRHFRSPPHEEKGRGLCLDAMRWRPSQLGFRAQATLAHVEPGAVQGT
jgi:hypothetical protein